MRYFLTICLLLSFIFVSSVSAQDIDSFIEEQMALFEDNDILNDQIATDALVKRGPVVLEAIIKNLEGAKRDKKAALIEAIGRIRDPKGFEPLRSELESLKYVRQKAETFADSYLRIMVIKALGDLGDKRAIPLLLKSRVSHDVYEKTHSLVSLEKLDYQGIYAELEKVAFGQDANCRNIVVLGLGRPGNTDALPLLQQALKDETWFVRASAVDALTAIGDKSVLETISPMLDDPSPYVRQAVEQALKLLEK